MTADVASTIAHCTAEKDQLLIDHLRSVGDIAANCAKKLGLAEAGQLLGLLHDFGKYSHIFQNYLKSAEGRINPDEDDYIDYRAHKGKIDHSTAGAQWITERFIDELKRNFTPERKSQQQHYFAALQALFTCIASHHSGLIDNLPTDINSGFQQRKNKPDEKSHLEECKQQADSKLIEQALKLSSIAQLDALSEKFICLYQQEGLSELSRDFYAGMLVKFLFSCLIDADRIDSADFEIPGNKQLRSLQRPDWDLACKRFERFIGNFKATKPIDDIRQAISDSCLNSAADPQNIYSLTVPTGGGKTLASLRFALHHAREHQLDRVIYIIPYTSIIDQNAAAIREALEQEQEAEAPWVLEHHSNLEPELQTWRSKITSENWDAPVVLTTMVQFLETLFAGGTRSARRLHQLANSVLIFDEIQTLPIPCTHLFCNAINFLVDQGKTTAVMCTATQPLLHQLTEPNKGQLKLSAKNELMPDIGGLFSELKRVVVIDKTRVGGWQCSEISTLAIEQLELNGSCLIVVNTKDWAQRLYRHCQQQGVATECLFHLSTSQCPAHRKEILDNIRGRLASDLPTLCISTQLIEAGVDVDFGSVIRFLAGLDSIAQAAGRCNRNGRKRTAQVLVVNPDSETVALLHDIVTGIECSKRILNEFKGQDLLSPEVMQRYFDYYFYARSDKMSYSIKTDGRDDSLLNLLSQNKGHIKKSGSGLSLNQSFMTAGKLFKAIDAPTQALIVPFSEATVLWDELCGLEKQFEPKRYRQILKQLQKYSVNLFPNTWRQLTDIGAITELGQESGGEGIFYLDKRHYSPNFGVSTDLVAEADCLIC